MHQGITDFIDHGTVELGIFTGHVQFHFLVEFLRKVTNHTRELGYHGFDGHHSNLHNGLVKGRGDGFEIFNLFIERKRTGSKLGVRYAD